MLIQIKYRKKKYIYKKSLNKFILKSVRYNFH